MTRQSLTDITERRTHGGGSDTKDGLDGFTCPAQLGNNLLVRHRSEGLSQTMSKVVLYREDDWARTWCDHVCTEIS